MRLLLYGDFACHSGFARVNEALARELAALGWDIAVLANNYTGDAHPLQLRYRLYPLGTPRTPTEAQIRFATVAERERPDVILVVNDPWIVRRCLTSSVPMVAYMPVDGVGLRRSQIEPLNSLAHAIAYTEFGLGELRQAGYAGAASVIPHGIDTDMFYPIDQAEARARARMDREAFAVLVFDRNQARKRLDIAFDAFARFAADKPDSVKLVYHGSLMDESWGWAIEEMAADLGIGDRLILTGRDMEPLRGVAMDQLRLIYSMCDVKLSTSSGEGWGLTTFEAMACGLPCIVPDHSAYHEWCEDAALLIEAPIVVRHAGGINTVGRVPYAETAAEALETLYSHAECRKRFAARGLTLVDRDCYRWPIIAQQFDAVLRAAVEGI